MSDEFILSSFTFCVILDRKKIFEILNYWFSNFGHVTTKDMEMSGMVVRIEWKHSRIAAGPASGRNRPLKSRNLGFGHIGTFFRSFRKFEKWEVPKKLLAIQSKLFLGGWNRSGVNRWPGGRAILETVQVPRENHACTAVHIQHFVHVCEHGIFQKSDFHLSRSNHERRNYEF